MRRRTVMPRWWRRLVFVLSPLNAGLAVVDLLLGRWPGVFVYVAAAAFMLTLYLTTTDHSEPHEDSTHDRR